MHVVIRIKGHLDLSWQEWLEELCITHESDSTTSLSGALQDQSALYGVIAKLGRLGLTIISFHMNETHK